ncbi:STAS domain-containing protein [Aestuariivirga sp.]|uniref:STAS domain-containing protein n=1 Tax=Aestuariivirga sp. TaxID=2650926 RepID=UPI00301A9C3D
MTVQTLKLEGRLDTSAVARIETGFAAKAGAVSSQRGRVIIDLQDVTYLSSMGIRLLVSTLRQFRQREVTFVTPAPREGMVRELLQMASLTEHLNMVDSAAAAETAFGGNSEPAGPS